MSKLILLSFVVCASAVIGANPVRQVRYQTNTLAPTNSPPTFDNGYLVVYNLASDSVYAPDGSLAYNVPWPENGLIANVAVDTDQTAAAAVNIGNIKGSIAILDRTGLQIRVIETGRYLPTSIRFAPDHSIWAVGRQARPRRADDPEYFVLRHFSRDGKDLGGFLPRSSFDQDPFVASVGLTSLYVVNGRIGVHLNEAVMGPKRVWVEIDLNQSKEIGRWPVDIDGHPAAVTPSGAVYAREVGGISVLDRETGTWKPVSTENDALLVGADGEALVLMVRGAPELRWVTVNP